MLRLVLLFTGPLNGAWYVSLLLGVPLLIARLGVTGPGGTGLGAFGLVISAYGCRQSASRRSCSAAAACRAKPARRIFAGGLVLGGGALLFAFVPLLPPHAAPAPASRSAAAIEAVGGPMQDIAVAVLRQTELPPARDTRRDARLPRAGNAGMLLAMLVAPAIFALIGLPASLALCAAVIAATGAIGLALSGWTGR